MDTVELTKLIGTRFIERRNVKSWQNKKGEWHPAKCQECINAGITCLHNPMTLADFEDHFSGRKTMGHYLVDPATQQCKLFAFDIDVRKVEPGYTPTNSVNEVYDPREAWLDEDHYMYKDLLLQVRTMSEGIARRVESLMKIPVAIATSGGKGFHVYCFTGSIPAEAAKSLAAGILEGWTCFTQTKGSNFWMHKTEYQDIEIETFPKQGTVSESGMGNLMALPLGINQRTGKEKFFVSTRSSLDRIKKMDAERALGGEYPWE